MRQILMLVALASLAGCKSAGDLRSRGAYAQATSQKQVAELAGCIALASAAREMEIGKESLPNGTSVTVAMRPGGIKTVVSAYDIEDVGKERLITLYDVGAHGRKVANLPPLTAACL